MGEEREMERGGLPSKNPDSGYGLQPGGDNKATSKCQHGFVVLLNLPIQQVKEP